MPFWRLLSQISLRGPLRPRLTRMCRDAWIICRLHILIAGHADRLTASPHFMFWPWRLSEDLVAVNGPGDKVWLQLMAFSQNFL